MNTEENKELKEKILKEVRKWHNKCNEEYPVKLEWDDGCVKKAIDLTFEEATKQAEKRFIEKVERLDKQFKHTLNEESLLFFEKRIVEKFYKKFNEIFSDEQKLTNHTPPQVTENRNSVLPRLANGSQQTAKGYPKEQKITSNKKTIFCPTAPAEKIKSNKKGK